VLRGDLRQQIGFQPWRQRQAVVHDDCSRNACRALRALVKRS
jgi:hypothetical protein